MKTGEQTRLKDTQVTALEGGLYEIEVDEGVELTLEHFEAFRDFFDNQEDITGILVNKANRYTLGFDYQLNVCNTEKIKAWAILEHSERSAMVTKMMLSLPKNYPFTAKMFFDRTESINWLKAEVEAAQSH